MALKITGPEFINLNLILEFRQLKVIYEQTQTYVRHIKQTDGKLTKFAVVATQYVS